MHAQIPRVVGWIILGLSLAALVLFCAPASLGRATEEGAAVAEDAGTHRWADEPPVVEETLPPVPEAPTTLVIWYRGQEVPSPLMRALDKLQRAGPVEAFDVEKPNRPFGRIFVLGQEAAIRALADLAERAVRPESLARLRHTAEFIVRLAELIPPHVRMWLQGWSAAYVHTAFARAVGLTPKARGGSDPPCLFR